MPSFPTFAYKSHSRLLCSSCLSVLQTEIYHTRRLTNEKWYYMCFPLSPIHRQETSFHWDYILSLCLANVWLINYGEAFCFLPPSSTTGTHKWLEKVPSFFFNLDTLVPVCWECMNSAYAYVCPITGFNAFSCLLYVLYYSQVASFSSMLLLGHIFDGIVPSWRFCTCSATGRTHCSLCWSICHCPFCRTFATAAEIGLLTRATAIWPLYASCILH